MVLLSLWPRRLRLCNTTRSACLMRRKINFSEAKPEVTWKVSKLAWRGMARLCIVHNVYSVIFAACVYYMHRSVAGRCFSTGSDSGRVSGYAKRSGHLLLEEQFMRIGSPRLPTQTTEQAGFHANLARSVRILRAFRTEQDSTATYYSLLADDTVRQLGQYIDLSRRLVLDVGGGPGFFVRALRGAGARAFCVDADAGELAGSGSSSSGSILGSALNLPVGSQQVDVSFSSNVLEHVSDPERMLAEMVRVTRPGGLVFCAFTNWLSPWGGHETSPWHYLGGERAARVYQRRYGRAPKNLYGRSLYPVSITRVLRWARTQPDAELIDAVPRYSPGWSRPLVRVPGAREFLTWNLLIVLQRRWPPAGPARGLRPR